MNSSVGFNDDAKYTTCDGDYNEKCLKYRKSYSTGKLNLNDLGQLIKELYPHMHYFWDNLFIWLADIKRWGYTHKYIMFMHMGQL